MEHYLPYGKILIETGSGLGNRIQASLDAGFEQVRSVEYAYARYQACREKFMKDMRVRLFLGDSPARLLTMMDGIEEPCVIVLDASPIEEKDQKDGDQKKPDQKDDIFVQHKFTRHNTILAEIDTLLKIPTLPMHLIVIEQQSELNSENQQYQNLLNRTHSFSFDGARMICTPLDPS
jgi:hypothetical protein